jgi:hypothetical protein
MQSHLEEKAKLILVLPTSEDQQNLIKAANMFISGKSELTGDSWEWPVGLDLVFEGEKKVFLISLAIKRS